VVLTIGQKSILVFDDAESGTGLWVASGSGPAWDSTSVDAYRGGHSFADSRYGNSQNNANSYLRLSSPLDLIDADKPLITFAAKWSIEEVYDYARIQVSTNGVSWISLPGEYTTMVSGQPSFTGSQHWVRERIDLSSYIGQEIQVRFLYHSDGGLPGDGFYFDDFAIVDYADTITHVGPGEEILPSSFISQNFPNPFNPSTTIHYGLEERSHVAITLYDYLGREIRTLVNDIVSPGNHTVVWDGRDETGIDVASGVYIYRMVTAGLVRSGKMLLVR
jgi:hypothetical protein